jgi:hypothetical protein
VNVQLLVRVLGDVVVLGLVARYVVWTRSAVVAWLLSCLWLAATDFVPHMPYALRLTGIPVVAGWAFVMFYPNWSPFGPLSGAERRCQKVVHRVSAGARAAYQAGTLAAERATFIADLEALDPPNDLWRLVKAAQLLDLRADPPQVGVGDATVRLVPWPWQDALDHRLLSIHRRLDDTIRARRLKRHPRPGFDEMPSGMRYDRYFLRILVARLSEVKAREGGFAEWPDEAAALLELGRDVRPPNATWARLRNLVLEVYGLELRGARGEDLTPAELERFSIAEDTLRHDWEAQERHEIKGWASAI